MGANWRTGLAIERTAWLSPCERYRHALGRHWDRRKGYVLFVMLNPSTADATQDDPTVRRCMRFAHDWGYGGIEVCNLFDWRATKPQALRAASAFAVSDKCDPVLRCRANDAAFIVAAWGKKLWAMHRILEVFDTAYSEDKRWYCLGTNGRFDGQLEDWTCVGMQFPRHPLYVKADQQPELFW